jgi:hypothetical protein
VVLTKRGIEGTARAHATRRSPSTSRNRRWSWLQLAKLRLTISTSNATKNLRPAAGATADRNLTHSLANACRASRARTHGSVWHLLRQPEAEG